MSGGSPLLHTKIDATSDGVNVVVTGRADQHIVVTGLSVTADAAGQFTFNAEDDSDYAVFDLATNGGVSIHGDVSSPVFRCARGDDLEVTNPASCDLSGRLSYTFVYGRG